MFAGNGATRVTVLFILFSLGCCFLGAPFPYFTAHTEQLFPLDDDRKAAKTSHGLAIVAALGDQSKESPYHHALETETDILHSALSKRDYDVTVLVSPTANELRTAIRTLLAKATSLRQARFVIYVSGATANLNDQKYLLTTSRPADDQGINRVNDISIEEIRSWSADFESAELLVICNCSTEAFSLRLPPTAGNDLLPTNPAFIRSLLLRGERAGDSYRQSFAQAVHDGILKSDPNAPDSTLRGGDLALSIRAHADFANSVNYQRFQTPAVSQGDVVIYSRTLQADVEGNANTLLLSSSKREVVVLEEPTQRAKSVARVPPNFPLLIIGSTGTPGWHKVLLENGVSGYAFEPTFDSYALVSISTAMSLIGAETVATSSDIQEILVKAASILTRNANLQGAFDIVEKIHSAEVRSIAYAAIGVELANSGKKEQAKTVFSHAIDIGSRRHTAFADVFFDRYGASSYSDVSIRIVKELRRASMRDAAADMAKNIESDVYRASAQKDLVNDYLQENQFEAAQKLIEVIGEPGYRAEAEAHFGRSLVLSGRKQEGTKMFALALERIKPMLNEIGGFISQEFARRGILKDMLIAGLFTEVRQQLEAQSSRFQSSNVGFMICHEAMGTGKFDGLETSVRNNTKDASDILSGALDYIESQGRAGLSDNLIKALDLVSRLSEGLAEPDRMRLLVRSVKTGQSVAGSGWSESLVERLGESLYAPPQNVDSIGSYVAELAELGRFYSPSESKTVQKASSLRDNVVRKLVSLRDAVAKKVKKNNSSDEALKAIAVSFQHLSLPQEAYRTAQLIKENHKKGMALIELAGAASEK